MEPKFGIIGCGNISRFHFGGLEKAGASIVHVADINEAAAAPYVKKYNVRYSKDYAELLADPEVTAVNVLTSSKTHKEICLAALRAGKDVVCEKTLTENAADSEELAKAARASGRLFYTAFMKRFFPAAIKAKELLPTLGRLYSAHVRANQMWGNYFELESDRGYEWILSSFGGAVVKCAGSHMIDMTMHMLGRPQSLYCNIDYVPNSRLDRKAEAIFEYEGGMTACFETTVHPLKKIGYERNSWDECIAIDGVCGRLELYTVMWDHPQNNGALLVHYDNEKETSTEYRFGAMNPFDDEMKFFCECLAERKQMGPGAVDGYNVDQVIETMFESSDRKASVALNWRGL